MRRAASDYIMFQSFPKCIFFLSFFESKNYISQMVLSWRKAMVNVCVYCYSHQRRHIVKLGTVLRLLAIETRAPPGRHRSPRPLETLGPHRLNFVFPQGFRGISLHLTISFRAAAELGRAGRRAPPHQLAGGPHRSVVASLEALGLH